MIYSPLYCFEENARRLLTIADYTTVPVSAYGLGLVKGIVDQTSDFYVDTKGLRGSLKVQVDGMFDGDGVIVGNNGSLFIIDAFKRTGACA